jgi:hypothetical protein
MKNIMWNWGEEEFVTGFNVLLVKMAYQKERRLNVRRTHYLEVT